MYSTNQQIPQHQNFNNSQNTSYPMLKKLLLFIICLILISNCILAHPGHYSSIHFQEITYKNISIDASKNNENQFLSDTSSNTLQIIENKIKENINKNEGLPFVFLVLLAFALGFMHSLTPGHGKSMIASYLVGDKATVKDAFILSFSTAITHVLDVFIIMILFIFLIEKTALGVITNYLVSVSAVLFFLFSINGFSKAIKEFKHKKFHQHHKSHSHAQNQKHSHKPILLGIITGLAPCPMAWALFLLAISLNRIYLGLFMLTAFSLGIILTILLLSLIVLKLKMKISKFKSIGLYLPILGYASMLIFSILLIFKNLF